MVVVVDNGMIGPVGEESLVVVPEVDPVGVVALMSVVSQRT